MKCTSSGAHLLVVLIGGKLVSSNALILTEVGRGLEGATKPYTHSMFVCCAVTPLVVY